MNLENANAEDTKPIMEGASTETLILDGVPSEKIKSRKELVAAYKWAEKQSKTYRFSYWPHQGEREKARRVRKQPK